MRLRALQVLVLVLLAATARGQAPTPLSLTRSQHLRLPLPADIQRIAIGDGSILSAEPINNRELLLLGLTSGRTSLLVWFRDGSLREYIVIVHRDLTLLEWALQRIHPSITAEIAPDRDAIVLTGLVPDITYSRAAELAANNYLNASPARVLIQAPAPQPPAAQPPADPTQPASPQTTVPPAEPFRLPPTLPAGGTVINLISIENLPPLPEQKLLEAIRNIGGAGVTVKRIVKGQVRDDSQDVFLLEGRVPNQVALTRILAVASGIITGRQAAGQLDIQVLTDEGGGLTGGLAGGQGGGAGGGGGFGGGGGGGFGGGGGGAGGLFNQVRRNVARAKAIQAGGGRIISILEVTDLPQVRVDIRLFEVNRSRLRDFSSNLSTVIGNNHVGSFTPVTGSGVIPKIGPKATFENILGFLGGTFTNETAVTAGKFALDSLLTYLEQQGVARSLSSPSLTVLSGENAEFQVGGEIPVPETIAPTLGATGGTAAVFSSVRFLEFGILLSVRPLVGEDDTLTLDVAPFVTAPDAALTATIRQNTGTNLQTTALNSRSLRTSARIQDGQALLVGGLLTRNINDRQASTPGLRDVPILGWLFKDLNRTDDSTELVVMVNPSIVRDPSPSIKLWEFPTSGELMQSFGRSLRP